MSGAGCCSSAFRMWSSDTGKLRCAPSFAGDGAVVPEGETDDDSGAAGDAGDSWAETPVVIRIAANSRAWRCMGTANTTDLLDLWDPALAGLHDGILKDRT